MCLTSSSIGGFRESPNDRFQDFAASAPGHDQPWLKSIGQMREGTGDGFGAQTQFASLGATRFCRRHPIGRRTRLTNGTFCADCVERSAIKRLPDLWRRFRGAGPNSPGDGMATPDSRRERAGRSNKGRVHLPTAERTSHAHVARIEAIPASRSLSANAHCLLSGKSLDRVETRHQRRGG